MRSLSVSPITSVQLASGLALLLGSAPLTLTASPDGWDCDFCPEPASSNAQVELGVGHADGRLDYLPGPGGPTQSDDTGLLGWLAGQWQQVDAEERRLRIQADRLGLDNPWLQLDDDRAEGTRLRLRYQQLQSTTSAVRTPFILTSDSQIALPEDWQRAGSTAQMSSLEDSLRRYRPRDQRRRLWLSAGFRPAARWQTGIEYRRDERDNDALQTASMLTLATLLPTRVDDSTDHLKLHAEYQASAWLARAGYGLSIYRNEAQSLRWDQPYSSLSDGADQGRLTRPPDNQAHQLRAAVMLHGSPAWTLSLSAAGTRQQQDAQLLPATINPQLLDQTDLPRNSARAEVDHWNFNLLARYRSSRKLRWQLRYRWDDRDNRTPVDSFQQVPGDVFLGTLRSTTPYSFRNQQLQLRGDYRVSTRWRLRLGVEQHLRERDRQDRRRTEQNLGFAEIRLRGLLSLSTRLEFGERDGSAFEPDADDTMAQRHRPFHLADRQHWQARTRLAIAPGPDLQLQLQAQHRDEDYSNSPLGLQQAAHNQLGLNLSGQTASQWLWHAGAMRIDWRQQQAGRPALSPQAWWARSRDLSSSYVLGLKKNGVLRKVDLDLNYRFSRSEGRVAVNESTFPDLQTRLHSLQIDGTWHWRPNLDWLLRYRYERYADSDWQFHALAADSVGNLLAGEQNPYDAVAHLISISALYRF